MRPTLREYVAGARTGAPVLAGQNWGYVFGAIGAVLFSMKAIFVKLAYQPVDGVSANEIDAISLMAMRLGFSMPIYILIFFMAIKKLQSAGKETPRFRHMLMAGSLGVLGYYICAFLDIQGLKYVTAQLERLLLFTYPVFVLGLSALFLGIRPRPLSLLGALIGYSGIAIIFAGGDITAGENLALGTAMILACALLFAAFQLLAKPMITKLGSTVFTCCAMFTAGIVIFTHLITQNAVEGTLGVPDWPARIWVIGLALAFFSTLIPSFLVNIAIDRIGPQSTAMLGLVSPVATVVFAIFWLGEPFGIWDALGTLITLLGIGFYSWYSRKPVPQSQPAARAK